MDKETLSNYGWVVICVLVIAVMIALATPFGSFVAGAVENTTEGLFGASQKAMNTGLAQYGVQVDDQAMGEYGTVGGGEATPDTNTPEDEVITHDGIIPTGATYTRAEGSVLSAGAAFPAVENGDKYTYNNFCYTYYEGLGGWEITIVDKTQSVYGEYLLEVNGKPLASAECLFLNNTNVVECYALPKGLFYAEAFDGCTNLKVLHIDANTGYVYVKDATASDITVYFDGSYYELLKSKNAWFNATTMKNAHQEFSFICEDGTYSSEMGACMAYDAQFVDGFSKVVGDYTYTYYEGLGGWMVSVNDKTKQYYGEIREDYMGKEVRSLASTFEGCTNLLKAPELPLKYLWDAECAFMGCSSLTEKPYLPEDIAMDAFVGTPFED